MKTAILTICLSVLAAVSLGQELRTKNKIRLYFDPEKPVRVVNVPHPDVEIEQVDTLYNPAYVNCDFRDSWEHPMVLEITDLTNLETYTVIVYPEYSKEYRKNQKYDFRYSSYVINNPRKKSRSKF